MADVKFSAAAPVDGTDGSRLRTGIAKEGSTTALMLQHVLGVNTDPTAASDETHGFSIGSMWFRDDNGAVFICRDNTDSAAVWQKIAPNSNQSLYEVDQWYSVPGWRVGNSNGLIDSGTTFLYPFYMQQSVTISDVAVAMHNGEDGATMQIGIYDTDNTSRTPTGDPLSTTGDIALDTAFTETTLEAAFGTPISLVGGRLYWIGYQSTSDGFDSTFITGHQVFPTFNQFAGHPTSLEMFIIASNAMLSSMERGDTYGVWPTLTGVISDDFSFGPSSIDAEMPMFVFKIASAP